MNQQYAGCRNEGRYFTGQTLTKKVQCTPLRNSQAMLCKKADYQLFESRIPLILSMFRFPETRDGREVISLSVMSDACASILTAWHVRNECQEVTIENG